MSWRAKGNRGPNGVFAMGLTTSQYLAAALGVSPEKLRYTAVGINHLTWFTDVRVGPQDAMPALKEVGEHVALLPDHDLAGRALETGAEDQTWLEPAANPFSWELLNTFGAFPAVLDRHVTEFFPQFFRDGQYFGATLGKDAWPFEAAVERGDAAFERLTEEEFSPDPLPEDYLQHSRESMSRSSRSSARFERTKPASTRPICPTRVSYRTLPEEAIVESPAVRPPPACGGSPSHLCLQLWRDLASTFLWVETIVEAALEGSWRKFVESRDRRCDQVAGRGRTTRRRPPLGPARPPSWAEAAIATIGPSFLVSVGFCGACRTLGYRDEFYSSRSTTVVPSNGCSASRAPIPPAKRRPDLRGQLVMYDGFQRAAVDGVRASRPGIFRGKQPTRARDLPSVAGESGPRYHRQARGRPG